MLCSCQSCICCTSSTTLYTSLGHFARMEERGQVKKAKRVRIGDWEPLNKMIMQAYLVVDEE